MLLTFKMCGISFQVINYVKIFVYIISTTLVILQGARPKTVISTCKLSALVNQGVGPVPSDPYHKMEAIRRRKKRRLPAFSDSFIPPAVCCRPRLSVSYDTQQHSPELTRLFDGASWAFAQPSAISKVTT